MKPYTIVSRLPSLCGAALLALTLWTSQPLAGPLIANEWKHLQWLEQNGFPGIIARRASGSPEQKRVAWQTWRQKAFPGPPVGGGGGAGGIGGGGLGGGSHINVSTEDLVVYLTDGLHNPATYDQANVMPGMTDNIRALSDDGTMTLQIGTIFASAMVVSYAPNLATANPFDLIAHMVHTMSGHLAGAQFDWGDFTLTATLDYVLDLASASGSPHDPRDPWVAVAGLTQNVDLQILTANLGLLTVANGGIAPGSMPVPELDIESLPEPGSLLLLLSGAAALAGSTLRRARRSTMSE